MVVGNSNGHVHYGNFRYCIYTQYIPDFIAERLAVNINRFLRHYWV